MKRVVLLCALLCLLAPSLLVASFSDELSFLQDSELYCSLMRKIWDREDMQTCIDVYETLYDSFGDRSDWESLCIRLKADTAMARYCIEGPKKNTSNAKTLLKDAESLYARIEKCSSSEQQKVLGAMKSDIKSIHYLLSPVFNIASGLDSTKIIDKEYIKYPDEVTVALMYANRRLYAPAIGGKDTEEALGIYSSLLESEEKLSEWDRFSVLSGLGMCLKEKGCYDEAAAYLELAMDIYHGDEAIIEALKEIGE